MTDGITSPSGEVIQEVNADILNHPVSSEVNADIAASPAFSEVNADIAEQRFDPYDWTRALSASVAAHAAKTANRRREREQLAVARRHGLNRRYAEKTDRLNQTSTTEPRSQP